MQAIARNSRAFTRFSSLTERFRTEANRECRRLLYIDSLHRLARASTLQEHQKLLNAINSAEQAYSLRNITRLRTAALELLTLQVDGAKEIGSYYLALSLKRIGQIEEAKRLFEITADSAPAPFKSRAIQSLGIISCVRGDLAESFRLQVDALRIASERNTCDPTTALMALLDISALNSLLGAHKEAFGMLQKLPLLVRKVSQWNPLYYYFYHNELAVELNALGRNAEARLALSVALRSPFAPSYPEWHETLVEIDARETTLRQS